MAETAPEEQVVIDPNSEIAAGILLSPAGDAPASLRTIYENHDTSVEEVEIKTGKPRASVLYTSELLIGHQDSAVDFFLDTVDRVAELPDDMRPDMVVASGFMQGDFRFLEKSRRATLVPELNNMGAQYKFGRQMLEKLQELNVPVIYNMSNDDRRIAEEQTVDVFRKMHEYAKSQEGVNWAGMDKMRQHPQWHTHHKFQVETVFPYCLRSGRQLYSAEEMSELTGGKIDIDEYFLLFSADQAMQNGTKVPPAHAKWLRDVKRDQIKDLKITDDVDIKIATKGRTYTDWIRHYMGLTPQSMYQNHMTLPLQVASRMAASGEDAPDAIVTEHNQEEVGVLGPHTQVLSTGGLVRATNFLKASGRRTDARGDVARRLVNRRRIPEPSASMRERTDNDRTLVTIFNESLIDKSDSLPNRMTIAELCDFQTGSISARPDLLAKYVDYVRTRMLGERSVAFFFGGDLIHGRNYPNFPSESQMTGLMSIDSQKDFNTALMQTSFAGVSLEELKALERVLVQPGNHEWNSGTLKWHGDAFVGYMRSVFERMYARAGFSDAEIAARVKTHEAVVTRKGDYAPDYTGVEYFGDNGVLLRHYLLERGAKGSNGGLPVYQTEQLANGTGSLMRSVDYFMAGHWHFPHYALLGDKLGIVGGSMAGMTGYEMSRGLGAVISGTLLHIGGGLPPQIEFVSEKALHGHKITTGGFSSAALKEEGFRDDRNFDPSRHGLFLPDGHPKSALQKKILQLMRAASQRSNSIAEIR